MAPIALDSLSSHDNATQIGSAVILYMAGAASGTLGKQALVSGYERLRPEDIAAMIARVGQILQEIASKLGEAVHALARIITDYEPDAFGQRQEFVKVELDVQDPYSLEDEREL